jgi:hypothetical protein
VEPGDLHPTGSRSLFERERFRTHRRHAG